MAFFDLGEAAVKLYDATVDKLEEQGILIPKVTYLAPGNEIVWDCEQFTMHMTRVFSNYPGADSPVPMPHAILMSSVEFFATMVRCIPTPKENGEPPDSADVAIAAQGLMNDARAIRRAFELIAQQHLVVPRNVPVSVGPVTSIGPSGGYAGVSGSFTFQIVDQDWADTPAPLARKANGQ